MTLTGHRRDWEDLATLDPYWAILSHPERKHWRWDAEEFFSAGQAEVDAVLETAAELGYPRARGAALDFGCGVGRTTQALGRHFGTAVGVDISAAMIARARELNSAIPNTRFVLNTDEDLRLFDDASFDLVYSTAVLQHLPSEALIRGTMAELVRLLRPNGLLVFQLPSFMPVAYRLQLGRKAYLLLRRLGVSPEWLYGRLGLQPMRMRFLPEQAVVRRLERLGARVLHTHAEREDWGADLAQRLRLVSQSGITSTTYYATRLPQSLGPGPAVDDDRRRLVEAAEAAAAGSPRHGVSELAARGRIARYLLARDPRLLADYILFYLRGRVMRSQRLEHRPIPDALTFERARRVVVDAVGSSSEGEALELARATGDGAGSARSGTAAAAARLAGDESLGELIYSLIRAAQPDAVIETGVATGVTSAYALAGLEDNAHGTLHSIDLPPTAMVARGLVGTRVPASLRRRWRYHWGDVRRVLPRVLDDTAGRRIFIHDSDHGYASMRWELEQAWAALAPGDWLLADDVDLHDAFMDVATPRGAQAYVVTQTAKRSCTGMMRRC
jgi:SAM-dependent methyltransferase